MRWIAATLALLLCQAAPAQIVYKCVGKDGRTEYSSWPCKAGQRTHQAIAAPPDPVTRYVPPSPRQSAAVSSRVTHNFVAPGPVQQARAAREAACQQARRDRDGTLARVGLKRNFDLLRRLDDTVRNACGGL
jgi:hypothetical protein